MSQEGDCIIYYWIGIIYTKKWNQIDFKTIYMVLKQLKSPDSSSLIDLGVVQGQPSMLDISGKGTPGQGYRYVRITDAGSRMSGSPYAGADIDAVGAINGVRK